MQPQHLTDFFNGTKITSDATVYPSVQTWNNWNNGKSLDITRKELAISLSATFCCLIFHL